MKRHVLILLLLALLTAGVFGRAIGHEFIAWDDADYVYNNDHINGGLTWHGVRWVFTEQQVSNWHPLTGLSHMLDCELFGLHPAGHHAVNVLLHLISTLLLYGVLWSMTRRVWPSAFIAALFAVHPLHVESVAWIAERKDVLSAFLGILAIGAYTAYARRGGFRRYARIFALLALGLMAKPMLVTWPFLFLLLDYWPLRRVTELQPDPVDTDHSDSADGPPPCEPRPMRRLIIEKLPLFGLSLAFSVLAYVIQQGAGSMVTEQRVPFVLRLGNAAMSYVRYLEKLVWPTDLSLLYPHPYLAGGIPWAGWQIAVAALLLVMVTAALAVAARRRAPLLVGWLWYVGTLVPVIGIVQVGNQAMADRFMYLPMIGVLIMLAWGTSDFVAGLRHRSAAQRVTAALAVIIIVACSALTWCQLGHWRNSFTVFEHAIEVEGNSAVMHQMLGLAHWQKWQDDAARESLAEQEQHFDLALAEFRAAARLAPDQYEHEMRLSDALLQMGALDDAAQRLRVGIRSLEPQPRTFAWAALHFELAEVLQRDGRLDAAIDACQEAVSTAPTATPMQEALQTLIRTRARLDQEIARHEQRVLADPDDADAAFGLARSLAAPGRYDAAIAQLQRVVAMRPDMAEAYSRLGELLSNQRRDDEAVTAYRRAVRLEPDRAIALNAAAWIQATRPDGTPEHAAEALQLAVKASALTYDQNAGILDTLAAAQAAIGDFDAARQTAARAIDMAMRDGQLEIARQMRQHLSFYEQNRPYRRPAESTAPMNAAADPGTRHGR